MLKARILIFIVLAIGLSSLVFADSKKWRSPETVEGTTRVDVQQAKELHARGVPFVDVRSARQYKKRHIPGAVNLYVKNEFNEANLLELLGDRGNPFVVYCNGTHCSLSYRAATKAVGWGFTDVHYFREGARGWRLDGNPLE